MTLVVPSLLSDEEQDILNDAVAKLGKAKVIIDQELEDVLEQHGKTLASMSPLFFKTFDAILWRCQQCELYKRAYEFGVTATSYLDDDSVCEECQNHN